MNDEPLDIPDFLRNQDNLKAEKSMSNLYTIDGHYNDGEKFEGFLMYEYDNEHPESTVDENIFFYGLDRSAAIASIGEEGVDFTITAVHEYLGESDVG